jgi:hypothetical protein
MRATSAEAGEVEIDLIVPCRDGGEPPAHVLRGIRAQLGVRLAVHRVDGRARPGEHRMDTITRARNRGSRLGSSPWIMFLDDDVLLGPGCVALLLEELCRRPGYAALAADYLGELGDRSNLGIRSPSGGLPATPHVAMGATLFRRDLLSHLSFRWESGRCECQCCCDDLRRAGFGIAYLPGAIATHRRERDSYGRGESPEPPTVRDRHHLDASHQPHAAAPRILTAFDRRHLGLFRHQFLTSLREAGNREVVTALAYGLWPGERRALEAIAGLEPVFLEDDGVTPSIRRLRDFQPVIARWPEETPVAHWDAGDVIFQDSLGPLWKLVGDDPDRILVVREPIGHPENSAVSDWTLSIHEPDARRYAFELLSTRAFLNAGFVAGTARAVLAYLREADRLLHSPALRGSSDWGDQTVLNVYCHSNPGRWREAPEGWNFTIYGREPREYHVGGDGRFVSARGESIAVVHGNAKTLKGLSFARLVANPGRVAATGV